MHQPLSTEQLIVVTLLQWAVTYWVYRDSGKHQVPNRNVWILVVFLCWPLVFGYLFYRRKSARGIELTALQEERLENKRRLEAEQEKIAARRQELAALQEQQNAENQLSDEKLEAIKARRAEDKAKRLAELDEERKLQEKRFADTLRLKKEKLAETVAENLKPKIKL